MSTRIEVRDTAGRLLGIFPGALSQHAEEIRRLIARYPDAEVYPVASTGDRCAAHPGFEKDYCPSCGTARRI